MELPTIRQTSFGSQSNDIERIRSSQSLDTGSIATSTQCSTVTSDDIAFISTDSDRTAEGSNIGCDSDSICSVFECGTPHESELVSLSESPTPIGKDPGPLDSDQIMLRIYLHAARSGEISLPEWDGLAEALRVYFAEGWHKDQYTLEEAEKQKEFLFWNAVGEEKWRASATV